MDVLSVRSFHSSRITTPWGKPSNLWTFWVYPLRPRTWIRCTQSATYRNTFMSPLNFAMSTATCNYAQTSSYLIPGQPFPETFMPLFYSNQDHTFMGDYVIPVLKQQTRLLLCLWRRIFHSDIQHCLDCSNTHSAQAFSCNDSFSTQ